MDGETAMGNQRDREGGRIRSAFLGTLLAGLTVSCIDSGGGGQEQLEQLAVESCMTCHNGSQADDYSGPGIEDPHPFPAASNIRCTVCHGGNPFGEDPLTAHVPPPPEIGDDANLLANAEAYFNRLTLTGIDKYPNYQVGGVTYSALDYLQFVNPGDLRVVSQGRSCGTCHAPHVDTVQNSMLATSAGIFSGATFAVGATNDVPENVGLYQDTAADLAFRAVTDFTPGFPPSQGAVGRLIEQPVVSIHGQTGGNNLFQNQAYTAANLADDRNADNTVVDDSELSHLFREQVSFTCGDCHLGSAGANNRYGDFRSSGCTACHMRYSLDGKSGSGDPNVDPNEPVDPDDIDPPERSHVDRHLIRSVAKTLPGGEFVTGIDDYTCAGCHQGSNRTVMQYWGIRLDQNQDLRFGNQYPANPVSFQNTTGDTRLFDPAVGNNTFNGRNRFQYILEEDYDGDGRDDTPPDVHYEAGLGCIDCHGSHDLHGGYVAGGENAEIRSRMEQAVAITCESCHGGIDAYAPTTTGTAWDGTTQTLAMDAEGHPLANVTVDGSGDYWLRSRLTGNMHYVSQTRDTVVDSGKTHPVSGNPIYSVKASYAMGRADGNPSTGMGPQQTGGVTPGFSHTDDMSCVSCHASWTNTCMGCHLEGEYNTGNNFSNITGDRIVFREKNADFVYQTPVHFQLGVGENGKIDVITSNTKTFFSYEDINNDDSDVFAFSDRKGKGNNTAITNYPSLAHNVMMPHSIRGKVSSTDEGPRYCTACHLTDDAMTNWGAEYATFRNALATENFAGLNFPLLQSHIGSNTGNQLNSPFFVHMAAGLGSGLFLFDENGCPINPLDDNANRAGCDGVAPSAAFNLANVALDLDRIVREDGVSTGSNNHALNPGASGALRDGALDPAMAGPLGATITRRLTDPATGIVLDSWLDADAAPQGDASTFVGSQ